VEEGDDADDGEDYERDVADGGLHNAAPFLMQAAHQAYDVPVTWSWWYQAVCNVTLIGVPQLEHALGSQPPNVVCEPLAIECLFPEAIAVAGL